MAKTDYAALTTKEAKREAIDGAKSEKALDTMWEAWDKQGWSRDGLLYARVLRRKQALGVQLSEGDIERVELTEKRAKEGAKLPPIGGRKVR